ncbi:hypothetical protein OG871_40185 (plasmid) [Kitasatospora sp. NBC_00374]|uniref:hypothetical protein n=1 Tax=Kitasatospora sp. NBC_00374 TaxID=2975964 RepID=UPI002F906FBD
MADTVEQQHADAGLLPADPAGLRLSLSVEYWPAGPGGRGFEEWSLLVRNERLQPGQRPSRTAFGVELEYVARVGLVRVPLLRGTITQDDYDALVGRAGEPALDQDVRTAVAEQVFTRRDGQRRLAPEVRASLAKGPRTDLGDLLLLDHFSVSADWAVQDLDLLLLGEAVTRAAEAGPCFVATAPSLLRSSPGSQHTTALLHRAGFRPMAGLTMVALGSGMPRLACPGEPTRAWRLRSI